MKQKRDLLLQAVFLAVIIGIIGYAVVSVLRKDKTPPSTHLSRLFAIRTPPSEDLQELAKWAQTFSHLDTEQQKQEFWHLLSTQGVCPKELPPLRLLFFLESRQLTLKQEKRIRFILSYLGYFNTFCPAPLAARLLNEIKTTPRMKDPLQDEIVKAITFSRRHQLPAAIEKLLTQNDSGCTLGPKAQSSAFRLLALHADREGLQKIKAAWDAVTPKDTSHLLERSFQRNVVIRELLESKSPYGSPEFREPLLVMQRLYGPGAAEAELIRMVSKKELPPAEFRSALAALSLAETSAAAEALMGAIDPLDFERSVAAASSLEYLTGRPFGEPGLHTLYGGRSAFQQAIETLKNELTQNACPQILAASLKAGNAEALLSTAERAEAGRTGGAPLSAAMDPVLSKFPAFPATARCFIAYSAGCMLPAKKLPVIEALLIGEDNTEVRRHLFHAAETITGTEQRAQLRFLTSLVFKTDPRSDLSGEIAAELKKGRMDSSRSPDLNQSIISYLRAHLEKNPSSANKWRFALFLRFFPSASAVKELSELSRDTDEQVVKSALFSACRFLETSEFKKALGTEKCKQTGQRLHNSANESPLNREASGKILDNVHESLLKKEQEG